MVTPSEASHSTIDRHVAGCFYCGQLGPYTDEHVVSAGLGGDDSAWMLRGCVCTTCNNTTFSRMEANVLKASHVGLMRLFAQPTTRDGLPPSPLQAPTTVELGADLPHASGSFGAGGQASLFAQIIFEDFTSNEVRFSILGPDRPSVEVLLSSLHELLQEEVVLIQKHDARSFSLTRLVLMSTGYQSIEVADVQKPPQTGIWFEPMRAAGTAEAPPAWTVFRRQTGQLVGRVPELTHLIILLSQLRPNLDRVHREFANTTVLPSKVQPLVHMGMTVDMNAVDRVMIKIGLNLIAHLFGVDIVRQAPFDAAVAFVLGEGESVRRAQLPSTIMRMAPAGRHLFRLSMCRVDDERYVLLLTVRLYDAGPVTSFVLAEFASKEPPVQTATVLVDYSANRIERVS
jgi:hypothetical protein